MCSYWAIKLAEDMNGDGRFTISDIGLWIKYLFFFPVDYLIGFFITKFPTFTEFIELGPNWCHAFPSGVFGIFTWGFCFPIGPVIGLGLFLMFDESLHKWATIKDKPR